LAEAEKRKMHFFIMHLSFLVYSLVGVASKTAASQDLLSSAFFAYALLVMGALAIYALMWQQVLKWFTLSKAYPNKGVVVVWGLLWAMIFFQETITIENIVGGAIIVLGIVLVSSDAD